jgi:prepilin-type N-terminal cleavage/methylation domain-containing protein
VRRSQKGFTIVELMIATSVFAVVLIICTIAMLQIGRTYYKGITSTRTQETAREIVDEVARAIQYGSGRPETLTAGGNTGYCIGNKRYSYDLDWQVADNPNTSQNQSRHALVVDDIACAGSAALAVAPSPPANPITAAGVGENPHELINTRMRLMRFTVQQVGAADSNLYRIIVRVVSGDNDLLTSDHMNCSSQRAGGQFCAVSELSTVVQKRVE